MTSLCARCLHFERSMSAASCRATKSQFWSTRYPHVITQRTHSFTNYHKVLEKWMNENNAIDVEACEHESYVNFSKVNNHKIKNRNTFSRFLYFVLCVCAHVHCCIKLSAIRMDSMMKCSDLSDVCVCLHWWAWALCCSTDVITAARISIQI